MNDAHEFPRPWDEYLMRRKELIGEFAARVASTRDQLGVITAKRVAFDDVIRDSIADLVFNEERSLRPQVAAILSMMHEGVDGFTKR